MTEDLTTNAAPLAQLREVEPEAWNVLMALGGTTADPEHQTALQSVAAHMLGDRRLGRKIASRGFYAVHVGNRGVWPDLASDYAGAEDDDQPCPCGVSHTRGEHGYEGDES